MGANNAQAVTGRPGTPHVNGPKGHTPGKTPSEKGSPRLRREDMLSPANAASRSSRRLPCFSFRWGAFLWDFASVPLGENVLIYLTERRGQMLNAEAAFPRSLHEGKHTNETQITM